MPSSLSISPLRLTSVEEVEEVEHGEGLMDSGFGLLPSAYIQSPSREKKAPGFSEWQEEESQRYSSMKARARSASQSVFILFSF